MTDTPFSKNQFYRLSLLLLFGKSLRSIDGERISGTERQIAASYPPGCDALVRAGWVATYPPPRPADLPQITASLAGKVAPSRAAAPRTAPVIARRPKPQSRVMDETLRAQEAELARLEQDIRRVQARRAPAPRK
jgi:hypothetical protein